MSADSTSWPAPTMLQVLLPWFIGVLRGMLPTDLWISQPASHGASFQFLTFSSGSGLPCILPAEPLGSPADSQSITIHAKCVGSGCPLRISADSRLSRAKDLLPSEPDHVTGRILNIFSSSWSSPSLSIWAQIQFHFFFFCPTRIYSYCPTHPHSSPSSTTDSSLPPIYHAKPHIGRQGH